LFITKDQKHYLEEMIPALLKQGLDDAYEIFIVDSSSTDGAVDYVRTFLRLSESRSDRKN